MKPPKLQKKLEIKKEHNTSWKDYYSWVHQKDILEVLKDSTKLNSEVKKYLDDENSYAKKYFVNTQVIQKTLFNEIKGRIKLSDTSIPFVDKNYEYWTKTTKKGNYSIKLRRKIGTKKIEEFWNGDKEKEALNTQYFGVGDLSISYNDKLLAYSLDLKGSEYYSIFIRSIASKKLVTETIDNTAGDILFSLDNKYIFYSRLDSLHRPKKIFKHVLGTSQNTDTLIFEEKKARFTVSISVSSDEKYFFINSGDHSTSEIYYFSSSQKTPEPMLFKKRKENVLYSLNSWGSYFYIHTNEKAEDFKISRCKNNDIKKLEDFIPAKKEVLIGNCSFLKNWVIRGEVSNAIPVLYARNIKTNLEERIIITNEEIYSPSFSFRQKDRNTDVILISYSSPKTPSRTYEYNLKSKSKKLIKRQIIPSGHNNKNYVVERKECLSIDGSKVPLTILRHKNTPINGKANLILYGYGAYGHSMGTGFSSTRISIIDRDIIWVTAHIRGGMERGMKWWNKGKMLNKKNTFFDYIESAKYLIKNKYTGKNRIIGMGGSAGGLLIGAVLNMRSDLFLGAIMAVPFVDSLTTNLDHDLPLTVGEFKEFGNAKKYKEHFEYIYSYAPYNNIKKNIYPNLLITTSLSDNRVLFDEPLKYVAKLREYKKDNNILLLKTEMEAGHGGKTGRDSGIEEIALDYAFILKITKKID